MPDMKYSDDRTAEGLSGVGDYVLRNRAAVKEMHRQVGDLQMDQRGVATRGLLVRHLVLPDDLAGTEGTARFLAEEISRDTYINVMDQYRPAFRASRGEFEPSCAGICRPATGAEHAVAVEAVKTAGLWRLDAI